MYNYSRSVKIVRKFIKLVLIFHRFRCEGRRIWVCKKKREDPGPIICMNVRDKVGGSVMFKLFKAIDDFFFKIDDDTEVVDKAWFFIPLLIIFMIGGFIFLLKILG